MTIEIQRPSSKYQFKQHKLFPCQVWWRQHKKGARWQHLGTCDTPEFARQRVLELERDPQARHTGNDTNEVAATRVRRKK